MENLRTETVETFAKLPDHALPALKTLHAGHPVFRPSLRSVPVACMLTLQSVSARIHPRLVESLARMRHLKSIDAKYIDLDGNVPLKEWQLEYVPGNPVWAVIPKTVCKGDRVARKIVVMVVAAVDDMKCMVHDIMGVACWCFCDCGLEPIKYKHWVPPVKSLDVEVLLQVSAGVEMCERVQQMFDEEVEKAKFVGRVTAVDDVALDREI
ncbi:hypothetical protein GGF31_000260 [Allomyces arbusculus]|nr:hypothetical protein GGF31_000260 [Allomyces arbusculus]